METNNGIKKFGYGIFLMFGAMLIKTLVRDLILGLFNDQMNGSLGAAIKHVVEQMQAVQRKETQYKADVVAAEQTLQKEKPIHSTEESPFEVLDVMMASEREKSDLIKKYEQPKNKKSRKRKREH